MQQFEDKMLLLAVCCIPKRMSNKRERLKEIREKERERGGKRERERERGKE